MRNRNERIHSMIHFLGQLLLLLGFLLLTPLTFTFFYWGRFGEGLVTLLAFVLPSVISFSVGYVLIHKYEYTDLDQTGSMLVCALAWIVLSAFGAIPFITILDASLIDAYFEAVSGFTTTGFTVFENLIDMPRSILFWRSLTQWIGGIGILSFFLALAIRGGGEHKIYTAESHKIASERPTPGLFYSVKILWAIYLFVTILCSAILTLQGMPLFESICHSLCALSTGGFSTHDASIAYYEQAGYTNFRAFEYTLVLFMMIGGTTFIIHYRVLKGQFKALWDNIEVRVWWIFIAVFTAILMLDHVLRAGMDFPLETVFRKSLFQVVSLITSTGFGTEDLSSSFFPAVSRQIFLVLMVIGACVGSTGGGIKVMRIVILSKQMGRELFKTMVSPKASTGLVLDKRIVPTTEVDRVAALFFTWMALILIGGAITAFFTHHGAFESLSVMFSAVGNTGPSFVSVRDMMEMPVIAKLTYIVGMLAGRLEIVPVLLLLTRKAWR